MRILIVDDQEIIKRGIRALLSSRTDWSVCGEASDGLEAIEKTKQLRPDVVLMDISMPRMGGVEATRILQQEVPESQVVIISQDDLAVVRRQAKELHTLGYVGKDDLPQDLLPTLDRLFSQRKREAQSNQRLRLALSAGKLGTWELDVPNRSLTSSAQCRANFGLSPNEPLTYEMLQAAIHPEDREMFREAVQQAIERGEDYQLEYRCVWPDGSVHWISARAIILRSDDNRALQMVGVTQEVTDRKLAEERERRLMAGTVEATAKFRALFDQSSVFAGIMTVDGTLIEANRSSLEACGYRAEDVLGRFFWETGWWRDSREVQEKVRAATAQAAQGDTYREELPYVWADGTQRMVDFTLHPIRDDQGKVIFIHPTGTDITERKLVEDRFRKLTDHLESEVGARTKELEDRNADVLKQSELLRVLSLRLMELQDTERRRIARELHDSAGQLLSVLNMNLSAIARMAKSKSPEVGEKSAECQEIVQQITQEIRTMSYLLHPPLLEETGLAAALAWYIKGLEERSGLDISLRIPKNFGRLPNDLELAVFRVVQECLTNIHRHSGSKTAFIRLSIREGTLLLDIRDQGTGISAGKLSDIRSHGSGVGIQGIRERLRPFGGNMLIDSNESGTTISATFEIPGGRSLPADLDEVQTL